MNKNDSVVENNTNGVKNENTEKVNPLNYSQEHYRGPIPHPNTLREFDNLYPGIAKKYIESPLIESQHRRNMEIKCLEIQKKTIEEKAKTQARQLDIAERGQTFSFLIPILFLCAALYFASMGLEVSTITTLIIPIVSMSIPLLKYFKKFNFPNADDVKEAADINN